MNDKLHGMGSFGRDDLSLLQRFAIQCGISLRNAGSSATFQSASPTVGQSGAVLTPQFGPKSAAAAAAAASQDRAGRSSSPDIPHSPEAPLGSSRRSRRKQRTEDVGSQCNLLNAPPLTKLKKEHGLTKHGSRANDTANDTDETLTKHGSRAGGGGANDGVNESALPHVVHERYQESVAAAAAKAQASVLDAHHGARAHNDARARPPDGSQMNGSGGRMLAMTPRAARLFEDGMPSAPQECIPPAPHTPPPRSSHTPPPPPPRTPSTSLTAGDQHGDRREVSWRAGQGTGGSSGRRDPNPDHDGAMSGAMSVVGKASRT